MAAIAAKCIVFGSDHFARSTCLRRTHFKNNYRSRWRCSRRRASLRSQLACAFTRLFSFFANLVELATELQFS
jgi:hypothetical protein